ncbi:hypothetical protein ACQ4PT_030246 [Festuca glaucescens]
MAAARRQVEEQKLRCTKEPYVDDAGAHRIKSIRFSTLSGNEVRSSAEVQVWNNRVYDVTRKPVPGGLLDTRMGAANKFGECTTCYGSYAECPGHFGYIKLALPVFNVGFFNNIVNMLKCICKDSELLNLGDRPEKLIITEIAVPPVPIRPSVFTSDRMSNEDSITVILKGIVNLNSGIKQTLQTGEPLTKCFARIMPWRTLRFNESVCNPYNADFDGDEMNLHVPQTEEARTEAFMLMGVKTAETGYMSRRLIKGLEDLSVCYDKTVRNASGGIVQFIYGDDGMDPVKMEGKGGRPLNLDQLLMKVMATCPQRGHDTLSPEVILQMLNDKLAEEDTASGVCSDSFKEMLTKFLEGRIKMVRSTRRALQLDENRVGRRNSSIEEGIAADISGISAKQLQVAAAIKIVLKSSQPCLVVKLDMQHIEAQGYMGISSDSVQLSILNHPKAKLKYEHVRVIDEAKLRIYPAGTEKSNLQFELHNLKSMLPKVIVKGIPTVERAVVNPVLRCDGTFDRYNLLVEGTNLLKVLGTPGVNAERTKSNHIMEVHKTLGIEAARRSIIDEIQYTFESNNMMIDRRHMMLLADLMTYKGMVLGITRDGIAKMKSSVLMMASFEKTAEHLFNGSCACREDEIEGVSECIIMGIPMKLGTGILGVRQKNPDLPEFKYQPDPILL